MTRHNKILLLVVTAVFTVAVVLFVFFHNNKLNKSIKVNYVKETGVKLISENEIQDMVYSKYPNFTSITGNKLDLAMLEFEIESHPSIKNADVYKKYRGVLEIDIEVRKPIVRIIDKKNNSFYISNEGAIFPLSLVNTVRVLVANGNFTAKYNNETIDIANDSLVTSTIKNIYKLAKIIENDKFLKSQITQVYINKNKEYELVPRVGRHIVLLGDESNFEKKMGYLKHFYINNLNKEGWRQYSQISLKYNNQIICTKNN